MRALTIKEIDEVSGADLGQVGAALAVAGGAFAIAGQITRFIPGAQLLSGGFTIIGIGLGGLAGAAAYYHTNYE